MDKDLIIHYFLQDPTLHQLNARLVNNNQANIISIIEMISTELGVEIDIDVLATKEGGLKDILRLKPKTTADKWILSVVFLAVVLPILVDLVVHFLTQDRELTSLQKEYYKAKLEEIKYDKQLNEKQQKEIDILKQRIDNIETTEASGKIKRKRSILYTQMNDNIQITSFAMEEYVTDKEVKILGQVDKKDFCKFIENTQRITEIDEDATIEIISPVLNNSKYKWRGNYNGEVIEFSVKDNEFKSKILNENLQFGSNNILSAKLEVRKDIDEYGYEKISSYAVIEVLGTETKDGFIEMPKTKKRRILQQQMDLFDNTN